jgi:hypothetical protein
VGGHHEQEGSSSAVMSAMYAVMRMFYSYQETYVGCMLEVQKAQAAQRRLRGRVRKHRRAARQG